MHDRVVAVEDRERQQDAAELVRREERRGGLGERGQHDGHAVALADAVLAQRVRRAVRERLHVAERE